MRFYLTFFILFLFMSIVQSQPYIIAHRGFSGFYPENTKASILAALEQKVDMIEIDIQETKDGRLVVIHDKTINRTTNGKGLIKELNLADIKKYDAGSWYDKKFNEERILTLEEVIEIVDSKAKLLIEIKETSDYYPGIENKLVSLIRQYNAQKWCLIQAFDTDIIKNVKNLADDILVYKLIVFKMRYFPIFFDTKIRFGNLKQFEFTEGINPNFKFASKHYVNKVHKLGKQVFCWTVNDVNSYNRLKKIGVNGVITNFPDKLNQIQH